MQLLSGLRRSLYAEKGRDGSEYRPEISRCRPAPATIGGHLPTGSQTARQVLPGSSWMRPLAIMAVFSGVVGAQSNRTACSLSAVIETEYSALPSLEDSSRSWQERMSSRRALAKKYPSDWPLQIRLQNAIRGKFHLGREWDVAVAHYRALPDRSLGELLEARLVSDLHRKKSREALDRVLAQAGDSPWPHLALLEWAADLRNGEPELAEKECEEFRRLCPESLRALQFLDVVQNPERLYSHLEALRSQVEKQKAGLATEELRVLSPLWRWEGIRYGSAGAAGFQRVVRSDLAAIRARRLYQSGTWYSILRFGYGDVLKDDSALKSLNRDVLQRAPKSRAAYSILSEQWRNRNPQPERPSREMAEAYRARADAFALQLLQRFWGRPYTRFDALRLLQDPQSNLPRERVERVADLVLLTADRFPDEGVSWPPAEILVADAYVRHKIRLDRVPELIARGLEQIDWQEKYRIDSDAFKNMPTSPAAGRVLQTQARASEILVRHAIATRQPERARVLLSDLRRKLDQSQPADAASRLAENWRRQDEAYLRLAKEAGVEVAPVAGLLPRGPEEASRYRVADFEAKDLSGKVWRLADLRGKVTYVNIWTTWCGACRSEMPGIQQLYERWKNRTDRAVLTISADAHVSLVQSFVKEHNYSFPVIHGRRVAEKFFPAAYFPQNWMIDPEGRRLDVALPRAFDTTIPQIEELAVKIAAMAQRN